MLGPGENGTVIDDFGETTNRDFQSQSYFLREDGLMMGGNANATIGTFGEETPNQVTNHLNTNTSGHGKSNRNNLRDQKNNPWFVSKPRNDARGFGSRFGNEFSSSLLKGKGYASAQLSQKSDSDEDGNEDLGEQMMQKDSHNRHYKHYHINDDHDAKRGSNIRNQAATPGFQLQMLGNAIEGTDQRGLRHQLDSQNEEMNRRASNGENQYQIGDIGDAGKDARGGTTRDLNCGPPGAGGSSSNLIKG